MPVTAQDRAANDLARRVAAIVAPLIAEEVIGRLSAFIDTADPGEMITLDQACSRLAVSRTTLWRWIKAGKLQTSGVGRTVRVPLSAIKALAR